VIAVYLDVRLTLGQLSVVLFDFVFVLVQSFLQLNNLILQTLVLLVQAKVVFPFAVEFELIAVQNFLVSHYLLHVRKHDIVNFLNIADIGIQILLISFDLLILVEIIVFGVFDFLIPFVLQHSLFLCQHRTVVDSKASGCGSPLDAQRTNGRPAVRASLVSGVRAQRTSGVASVFESSFS
jgi:hypothetical protein